MRNYTCRGLEGRKLPSDGFRMYILPQLPQLPHSVHLPLLPAANIHALSSAADYPYLIAASLLIWPVMIGLPAFLTAIIIATLLKKIRPDK